MRAYAIACNYKFNLMIIHKLIQSLGIESTYTILEKQDVYHLVARTYTGQQEMDICLKVLTANAHLVKSWISDEDIVWDIPYDPTEDSVIDDSPLDYGSVLDEDGNWCA